MARELQVILDSGEIDGLEMDSGYTPSIDADVAVKKYVDDQDAAAEVSVSFTPQSSDPAAAEGKIFYDDVQQTLAVMTDVTGVINYLSNTMFVRVHNDTGSTIDAGMPCKNGGVYATSGLPKAVPAQANTFPNAQVMGLAVADIADGAAGFLIRMGILDNIDTDTPSLIINQAVYLSGTIAGGLSVTAADIVTRVGKVMEVHATTGKIFVSINNNVVNPVLYGLLQNNAGTYTLAATYATVYNDAITGAAWTSSFDTGITVVKDTGLITIPNTGWYKVLMSMNITMSANAGTDILDFQLYRTNNTPAEVAHTTITLAGVTAGSRSATIPFEATAGDILAFRVASLDSSTTSDLTFDAVSVDVTSVSIT